MEIKDGRGSGYAAAVNERGRVAVDADKVGGDSAGKGNYFILQSQDLNIDAADTLLCVRNDGNVPFAIDRMILSTGATWSRYECHIITASFTAAGTAVTPKCLNTGLSGTSALAADLTVKSDETGNTQGAVIYDISLLALTTLVVPTPGLILARGVAFGIDQVTESAAGAASIEGHFLI